MNGNGIPSYDSIKDIKGYATYFLFSPRYGGIWQLTLNESLPNLDGEDKKVTNHNIALDYYVGGHISPSFTPYTSSKYKCNKLYKFNKSNYDGIVDMYFHILYEMQIEIDNKIDSTQPKHIVYKSYDKLKKELGSKYDTYMYNLNLDLTTRIDEATEYVEKFIPRAPDTYVFREAQVNHILNILKGDTIK